MIYINFSSEINQSTSEALMNFLADKLNKGESEFYVLFSSPGGRVINGVNLFNYIRSLPVKFIMHNIGIVDSVANVVFLAGDERYANPHSSFLFHGVGFDIDRPTRFEEKNIKERLTQIQRDQTLIMDIILKRSNIKEKELEKMLLEAETKKSAEAKKLGLIQEVREAKVPKGTEVFSFVFQQRPWR